MRLVGTLGLLLIAAIAGVSEASAQLVSITVAPPVLPVYEQPAIPGPGYIWTPGYWAWGDDDYYWVPGTWALPPAAGLLWTPGYWGWRDGIYAWNAGYWGPHIGFYGGINYGFGYTGVGYAGGVWRGGVFSYNRTVNNFGSVKITNTYNKTVINNTSVTNVSFNGGTGGTSARATQQELATANEQHTPPTAAQTQHQNLASANPAFHNANNGGHPQIAATSHSGQFSGAGVVGARTADTGPAGRNPAAGASANRGPAGGIGTPGAGNRPNNVPSRTGAATGPGGAAPAKLTSTTPGGPGPGKLTPSGAGPGRGPGGGPGGGAGPGRGPGGGPGGARTANFARPNGGGPRPGGGPHPAKGPPPHH
jgi:hypothetical protein